MTDKELKEKILAFVLPTKRSDFAAGELPGYGDENFERVLERLERTGFLVRELSTQKEMTEIKHTVCVSFSQKIDKIKLVTGE